MPYKKPTSKEKMKRALRKNWAQKLREDVKAHFKKKHTGAAERHAGVTSKELDILKARSVKH